MKASEARKIRIKALEDLIRNSAKDGFNNMTFYGKYEPNVCKYFMNQGYGVEFKLGRKTFFGYTESFDRTVVSWKD